MSPYEMGWRDGYNWRPVARNDPAYREGYGHGRRDWARCAAILAGLTA